MSEKNKIWKNSDLAVIHAHTAEGSLLDGMCSAENLAKLYRGYGFYAGGINDHGTLQAVINFLDACKAKLMTNDKFFKENNMFIGEEPREIPPMKPLIGMEAYFSLNHEEKQEQQGGRKGNYHITLIAKNFQGYKNLNILSDISWRKGFYSSPRIDMELLSKYSDGLICTTGCGSSVVSVNLLKGRYEKAKKITQVLKNIFKEDLYGEIMNHFLKAETMILEDQLKLFNELDIPPIVTNDSHILFKHHSKIHETFLASATKRCIKDDRRMRFSTPEFYVKQAHELAEMFGDMPQLFYNTKALADKVDSKDIYNNLFGVAMRLPVFEVPDNYKFNKDDHKFNVKFDNKIIDDKFNQILKERLENTPSNLIEKEQAFANTFNYIKEVAYQGLKDLGWDKNEKCVSDLESELNDVYCAWIHNKYDFATYFAIVSEMVVWAKNNKLMVGFGRGCLSGNETVYLENGNYKLLKDIIVGDRVFTANGECRTVLETHKYNIDENLLKIRTYFGDKEGVTLTKDHKILCEKSRFVKNYENWSESKRNSIKIYEEPEGKLNWIKAEDIKVNDWLFMPFDKTEFNNQINTIDLGKFANKEGLLIEGDKVVSCYRNALSDRVNKKNYGNRFVNLDKDFAYMIGKFISDGWLRTRDKNLIGFAFNKKEKERLEKILNYFNKIGFNDISVRESKKRSLIQIEVRNKFLYELIKDLLPDYKMKADTKYIPDIFMKCYNKEILIGLINGMFDGDGHRSKEKNKYTTISKKMAEQLRILLWRLKIPSTLRVCIRKDLRKDFQNIKPVYEVVTRVCDEINGFNRNEKMQKVRLTNDGILVRVYSIEEMHEVKEVYDLTIDKESNYLTNSFIVHNSGYSSVLLRCLKICSGKTPVHEQGLLFSRFLAFDSIQSISDSDFTG